MGVFITSKIPPEPDLSSGLPEKSRKKVKIRGKDAFVFCGWKNVLEKAQRRGIL
jgi:hypothetical protein